MYKTLVIASIMLSSFSANATPENDNLTTQENDNSPYFSFGIGIGYNYAGLGFNVALVSETDFKYIALGCSSVTSYSRDCDSFGVGWIKSDIFDFGNNKHGLGLFLYSESDNVLVKKDAANSRYRSNRIYEYGVQYTYYMNEINNAGFNFGVHLGDSYSKHRDEGYSLGLQVGYQF